MQEEAASVDELGAPEFACKNQPVPPFHGSSTADERSSNLRLPTVHPPPPLKPPSCTMPPHHGASEQALCASASRLYRILHRAKRLGKRVELSSRLRDGYGPAQQRDDSHATPSAMGPITRGSLRVRPYAGFVTYNRFATA